MNSLEPDELSSPAIHHRLPDLVSGFDSGTSDQRDFLSAGAPNPNLLRPEWPRPWASRHPRLYRLVFKATGFLWRNRRWGTYALVVLVLLFIGLALVSFNVVFTRTYLGIRVAPDGTVTEVVEGSLAQQTGAVLGATTGPLGYSEIDRVRDTLRAGDTASITLFLDAGNSELRPLEIRVMAQELPPDQKLVAIIESLTALLFMVLGLLLLQMRKQNFLTYLQFVCFEAGGLMVVAAQSRAYATWAGVGWAFAMPVCFATFAHLHMYFPAPRLGKWRGSAAIALYGVTALAMTLNLVQISLQTEGTWVYVSAWYEAAILMFIATCFLLATSLLIRTGIENRRVRNRVVGRRLGTLRFTAASFLLIIVAPVVAMLTHLDMSAGIRALSYFGSWVLALGYTRAMFQGEPQLGANLVMRKRVITAAGAGLLLFVWLVIAVTVKTALGDDWMPAAGGTLNNGTLVLWGVLCALALLLGGIIVAWNNWADAKLFRVGKDVAFVSECSEQLAKYTTTNEFVYFFTELLSSRLKTRGNIVLLSGPDGSMALRGYSHMLRDSVAGFLYSAPAYINVDQDLRAWLAEAESHQPIVLNRLPQIYWEPYLAFAGVSTAGLISRTSAIDDIGPTAAANAAGAESHAENGSTAPTVDSSLRAMFAGIGAEILLPLRAGPRLVGAVAMCGKEDDEPYTDQELDTLAAVGRYAALSMVNVRLIETLQRQLAALVSEKERTAQLAQDVYRAGSRERAQIAREIHDTALQDLTLVSRLLYMVRDDLATALNEISRLGAQPAGAIAVAGSDGKDARSSSAPGGFAVAQVWGDLLETLLGEQTTSPASDSASQVAMPYLKTAIESVHAVSQNLRAICTKLRPAYLNLSVKDSMKSVVEEEQAACDIPVSLAVSGVGPNDLPDNVKDALHNVAKIALSNAATHSHATHIGVTLDLSSESIELTIMDDGCGFMLADLKEYQATNRFGLVDMHEYALMVDGQLAVVTAPGKGTTVRFCLRVPTYP